MYMYAFVSGSSGICMPRPSLYSSVSKFGFDCHADLLLLYYFLGVGDHARPIEKILPAFARQKAAKDALDKLQRARRGGKEPPAGAAAGNAGGVSGAAV